jgi:hypothetical protein
MTKAEYINRVLLIMNEAGMLDATGHSLFGADVTQVDRHIEGSFVDAWRRCVKVMPRTWFKTASFKGAVIYPDLAGGTGCVELPSDFYLLTAFRMAGWRKPAYQATIEDEKTASVQSNEYTRGSELRPVCTISTREVGVGNIRQVLNYYSLQRGLALHTVDTALYIPVCTPLTDHALTANVGLDEQVIEPMAYLSASTVFVMFEKYDIAKTLEAKAVEMFPGLARVRGTNVTINQ